MITEAQFNRLMEEDIFEAITDGEEISGSEKGGLYSRHASWAVWKENSGEGLVKASNDKSVIASYDVLSEKIHANAVLLGLNSGTFFSSDVSEFPWATFHSGTRDYNLANAVRGTIISGAYMTDLYKGLPTRDGGALKKLLTSRGKDGSAKIHEAMRLIFEREMEILGASADVPVICLGLDTYVAFQKIFGKTRNPIFANHYAMAISKEKYSDQFKAIEKSFSE